VNDSCLTNSGNELRQLEYRASATCSSHVSHVNESCLTFERVPHELRQLEYRASASLPPNNTHMCEGVYMCVCTYMQHMCVRVYTYIYIYIRIYTHTHTYIYKSMYTYVYIYMNTRCNTLQHTTIPHYNNRLQQHT